MPAPVLDEYIRNFGFGHRTGVELPAEPAGLLAAGSRWTPSTQASISFGQEIGVTALQMISAVGAVANDGVLVPPRIVLGTRDAAGAFHPAATGEPRRVVASRTSRILVDLLEGVVSAGTGKAAAVPGYRVAGKTGTAQKVVGSSGYSPTEFVASFAGFAPAGSPRIAAIVVLDTPYGSIHTGGLTAAPVFSRIVGDALAYLRVPPDEDPLVALQQERERRDAERAERKRKHARRNQGRSAEDEEAAAEVDDPGPLATIAGQVPDLRGMTLRGAVSTLVARRYRARAEGSGFVIAQIPSPGTELPEGEICSVILAHGTGAQR
jgi:membrane peptidoglycan carboxypeptidase